MQSDRHQHEFIRHDGYRRFEAFTGEPRRQWSDEEKARIVSESFAPGANISAVARRHGISGGLIGISGGRRIFLATQPIDFRKGMDTIAALVSEALKADPFCGDMFIFRPKRCDRLKILVWDGSGLILATKRLEEGRFC